MTIWQVFVALAAAVGLWLLFDSWLRLRRAEFIRTYEWPPGLLDKLSEHHPGLDRKDSALVSRGLRQFFVAYLMSGKRFVSMPSRVADDLWHEFILYTREYQSFCRRAFGSFMHHTPATVLSENRKSNAGLRRVWWYCCKYENIDAGNPTRLPLLFALDSIPAIYGLTKEPYIVLTANLFALMGLRQLYFLIGGLLKKLVYMSLGLSVLLAFIGVKLILHALHENTLPFINGGEHVSVPEISTLFSLGAIVVILGVTTVASLWKSNKDAKQGISSDH